MERIAPTLPRTLGAKFRKAVTSCCQCGTSEARRFARQLRKQRSDEVHAAREDALAARKIQYDLERIRLKSQNERETKEKRVEPATLRAEAAAEWTSYAEEHNLPEQKKCDWMERLQEEDAALLQATAEQKLIKPAPERPADAPPLHAFGKMRRRVPNGQTPQFRPRRLLPPTWGVTRITVRKPGSIG